VTPEVAGQILALGDVIEIVVEHAQEGSEASHVESIYKPVPLPGRHLCRLRKLRLGANGITQEDPVLVVQEEAVFGLDHPSSVNRPCGDRVRLWVEAAGACVRHRGANQHRHEKSRML